MVKSLNAHQRKLYYAYSILSINSGEWSETTLNYKMMMERYPNLKEEVGGSIPDCESSSPLDIKLGVGMSTFYQKKKKEK